MENKRASVKDLRARIAGLEDELRRARWQKEKDDAELAELRSLKLGRSRELAFDDGSRHGQRAAQDGEIARLWHVLRSIVGDKTVLDAPLVREEDRFASRRPSPFDNFPR